MRLAILLTAACMAAPAFGGSIPSTATDARTVVAPVHPKLAKIERCMSRIVRGMDYDIRVSDTNVWCISIPSDHEPTPTTAPEPTTPTKPKPECTDPDECHDHPLHDPAAHDFWPDVIEKYHG